MTGEERAKKFWKIRNKNFKAKKRKKLLKKLQENYLYISLALSSSFVVLLLIIGLKASFSTQEVNAAIKEPLTKISQEEDISNHNIWSADSFSSDESISETKSSVVLEIDYSKRVQYQSLTFRNTNARKEASLDSDIIAEIPQNTFVDVLEDQGNWIKVLYNGSPAYVKSDYVGTIMEYKKFNSIGKKTFTNVNVRTKPSEDSESAFVLDAGTDVNFVKNENGWSEILYNDQTYYIKSDYIGDEDEYKEYQANLDKTPYSTYLVEKYGFSKDLQKYTYDLCKEFYPADPEHYYALLLGMMQQESDFGRERSNYNKNGSRDLGILQVNSCNWKGLKKKGLISSYDMSTLTCDELQYNDYINIRAAMDEINICVNNHGISENAYWSYNTGKHKKKGTNSNSHKVWKYYKEWCNRLYQE